GTETPLIWVTISPGWSPARCAAMPANTFFTITPVRTPSVAGRAPNDAPKYPRSPARAGCRRHIRQSAIGIFRTIAFLHRQLPLYEYMHTILQWGFQVCPEPAPGEGRSPSGSLWLAAFASSR